MKTKWLILTALLFAVALAWVGGCDCDDDDDDDDDNASDDDTADDDTTDDDTADDDSGDDDDTTDDDTGPPYDTAQCEPFVTAFYEDCRFTLTVDEQELSAEEAVASCEEYQYLFWPCALECFADNADACLNLYNCLEGCFTE